MPDMLKVIVNMCKLFHMQVIELSKRFLEQVSDLHPNFIDVSLPRLGQIDRGTVWFKR